MKYKNIQSILQRSVKLFFCGLLLFFLYSIQTGSAAVFFQDGTNITGDTLFESMNNSTNMSLAPFPIQFFYNTHCGSCQKAVNYLNKFETTHPDIKVEYHDLYNSSLNNSIYAHYKTEFNNNTDIHYPVIFIGKVGIAGSYDIILYTEPLSGWYQDNKPAKATYPEIELYSWIKNLLKV